MHDGKLERDANDPCDQRLDRREELVAEPIALPFVELVRSLEIGLDFFGKRSLLTDRL